MYILVNASPRPLDVHDVATSNIEGVYIGDMTVCPLLTLAPW